MYIWVPKGDERENGPEALFNDRITENFKTLIHRFKHHYKPLMDSIQIPPKMKNLKGNQNK